MLALGSSARSVVSMASDCLCSAITVGCVARASSLRIEWGGCTRPRPWARGTKRARLEYDLAMIERLWLGSDEKGWSGLCGL